MATPKSWPSVVAAGERDSTDGDRLRVLRLVESGTISAEQAVALLDALEAISSRARAQALVPRAGRFRVSWPSGGERGAAGAQLTAGGANWLRLRVLDGNGRHRVDVRLPIGVLGLAFRIGGQWVPQLRWLNPDEVIASLPWRGGRRVFRVDDDLGGDWVEISVE